MVSASFDGNDFIVGDNTFHLTGADGVNPVLGGISASRGTFGGSYFIEGNSKNNTVGDVQTDTMFVVRGDTKGFNSKGGLTGTFYFGTLGSLQKNE